MQFPGMATDPVRARVEVTWWPEDDSFSLAFHVWTRPIGSDCWQLEGMHVTGSPVRLWELPDRWASATDAALTFITKTAHPFDEPDGPPHL